MCDVFLFYDGMTQCNKNYDSIGAAAPADVLEGREERKVF